MLSRRALAVWKTISLAAAVPVVVFAYAEGPDAGLSGVSGEATCTYCHSGSSGSGSVKVAFPGDLYYTPGTRQHLVVTVADSAQRRWGFQLTARTAKSSSTMAGSFTSTDGNTQTVCTQTTFQSERFGSCASGMTLQYIEHTLTGTRTGQKNSATFEFDWTPPAPDSGDVVIYVAGNAANGDGTERGDHIYTAQYTLKLYTPPPVPSISQNNGVVNSASLAGDASAGTWLTINGTNLAGTTRGWTANDLANGTQLPTQLDNVSVTVDGNPAPVLSVSPAQVIVLAPADTNLGPVSVQVTYNGQTSSPASVQLQPVSPGLFTWNAKYAVQTLPTDTTLPDLNNAPAAMPTVKPGDTVVLWGTGFGPTTPAVAPGSLVPSDQPYAAANPVTITIGGAQAQVTGTVLAPGTASLYLVVVVIPDGLGDGDQAVVAQVNGIQSAGTVNVAVQNVPPAQ